MSGLFATLIAAAQGTAPAVRPRPATRFEAGDPSDAIAWEMAPAAPGDAAASPAAALAQRAIADPPVPAPDAVSQRPRTATPNASPHKPPDRAEPSIAIESGSGEAVWTLLPARDTPTMPEARSPSPPLPGVTTVAPAIAAHAADTRPNPAASRPTPSPDLSHAENSAAPIVASTTGTTLLPPTAALPAPDAAPRDAEQRDAIAVDLPTLKIGRIEVRPAPPPPTAAAVRTPVAATTRVALPRAPVRQSLDDYRAGRRR